MKVRFWDKLIATKLRTRRRRASVSAAVVCLFFFSVLGFQNCAQFSSSFVPQMASSSSIAGGISPNPVATPKAISTPSSTATPGTAATPTPAPIPAATPLAAVKTTLLSTSNTGYATAGFHPRVIANGKGIFTSYETDRNDSTTTETTHIDWSHDEGASFSSLFSRVVSNTASSSLQSDEETNLLMADLGQANTSARVYVFNGFNNFADAPNELAITYPAGTDPGSTKFTFFYAGNQTGYYSDKHRLFKLNFQPLSVVSSTVLIDAPNATGDHGIPQYPNLTQTDDKRLLFSWTTSHLYTCASSDANCTTSYLGGNHYLDNHLMMSSDAGQTWSNGLFSLDLPVISDSQGSSSGGLELTAGIDISAALHLTGDNFLHSVLSRGDYIHYIYMQQGSGGVSKYGRYRLSTKAFDIAPTAFCGKPIALNSNGIFLVSGSQNEIYAVGAIANGDGTGKLAALISIDQGATWNDYAIDTSVSGNIQYITGPPSLSSGGFIVGEFTI